METSKRIRILKYEYLRLSNKLSNIEHCLEEANMNLKKLREMESKIDQEEGLSEEETKMIGLTESVPSFMIRYRLAAELRRICEDIKKYEREHALITQAMRDLKVCPECEGKGVKKGKTEYVRLEGGAVIPSFELDRCELCGGRGMIDLEEVS